MESKEKNSTILIHLENNEDLFNSLKLLCKKYKIKNGFILSGIGQLKNINLAFYKKSKGYVSKKYNEIHELLNLSGNICCIQNNYEFHIHAILSNKNMNLIGGHLIEGNVEYTNEIVILKTTIDFKRYFDETSGLKKILIKE
jgi:predicted DNA-binding protein with PD1-like motif